MMFDDEFGLKWIAMADGIGELCGYLKEKLRTNGPADYFTVAVSKACAKDLVKHFDRNEVVKDAADI